MKFDLQRGIYVLHVSVCPTPVGVEGVCLCVFLAILQARSKLSQIQDSQQEVSKSIEKYNTLNGTHGGSMTNLADMSEGFGDRENGGFQATVRTAQVRISFWNLALASDETYTQASSQLLYNNSNISASRKETASPTINSWR